MYKKLEAYAAGEEDDKCIFSGVNNEVFMKANIELARRLKVGEKELKAQNITFYSGRHFWKTLMNAGGLGETAEEVFMGHSVSGDMAKLYNHRDKLGEGARLCQK